MGFTDGSLYFRTPTYTAAEWTARNPILAKGECGYELHPTTNKPWRYKVGNEITRWNDLPYQEDLYPFTDIPTNEIGDAAGLLQYLTDSEILKKMLNPLTVPSLSSLQINVNSLGYTSSRILEIGQTIASPVLLNASIISPATLDPTNPFNIVAGGTFTNEGNFNALPASLTLSPLTPSAIFEATISAKAKASNGKFSSILTALLAVYPKIIWGVSNATSLIPGDWATLTNRQTLITKTFENDYSFTVSTSSYLWIAIPSMLSPGSTPWFADVTNPLFTSPITFQDKGVQSINNGVGTYNYQTFRSIYSMTENIKVRMKIYP